MTSTFNLNTKSDEILSSGELNADLPPNVDDKTPDKLNDDILLKLLSSLEGLTPAGLDHLMET